MKARRQREILRLIGSRQVRTQDELSAALAARAIKVNQSTLSRDLRELAIVKTAAGYVRSDRLEPNSPAQEAFSRVVAQFLRDLRTAQNLVVLRTAPGGANALAQLLDASDWPDIVGTIAGDDTIFVATLDASTAQRVRRRIEAI